MRIETKTRWMELGADGRHVSLGRAEPSTAEVIAARDALATQGLPGSLVRMQGDYWKVTLEPIQRIGIAHDVDWQAALTAYRAACHRATH